MKIENEGLSPGVIHLIKTAADKAIEQQIAYVGAEHLLLSVCLSEEMVQLISRFVPFKSEEIRDYLLGKIGVGSAKCTVEDIACTPRFKRVLKRSKEIAEKRFSKPEANVKTLFLALLMEDSGLIFEALKEFGLENKYGVMLSKFRAEEVVATEEPFPVAHKQELDCKNGYTLTIKALRIPTDPTINVFSIDLSDSKTTWLETFGTDLEVNAFIRGISAGASMFDKIIPLPPGIRFSL